MKPASLTSSRLRNVSLLRLLILPTLMFTMTIGLYAQSPELSLADLLIGLRSKKVSLQDRNKILTEAVKQRGITFMLTAEIERELAVTGADPDLLAILRQKTQAAKAAAEPPKPVATPTPAPDFRFFKARADASAVKGDFSTALVDYNKSLELKNDLAPLYYGRGRAYFNTESYDLALKDFDKAIELDPKDATAYFSRGLVYEKLGNKQKAVEDYQQAVSKDAGNEQAKLNLKRLQDEIAKAIEKAKPPVEPVKPPEFINRGNLTADNAVKLVTPVYSPAAQRANIEGRDTVDVEIDGEGNVVSAKASNGHQMLRSSAEDAAERSKFQPAMFDSKPIRSKGSIVYNFSLKPTR